MCSGDNSKQNTAAPASIVDVSEVQPVDFVSSLETIDPALAQWLRANPDWQPDAAGQDQSE